MTEQFHFLRTLWGIISGAQTARFPSWYVVDYVDSQVASQLSDTTTVAELSSICESCNAVSACFDAAIAKLKETWPWLTAAAKLGLIRSARGLKLETHFGNILFLTEEEERDLKIRWDLVDILYNEEKHKVVDQFRAAGVDLEAQTANLDYGNLLKQLGTCTRAVIALLTQRIAYDYAAVIRSGPLSIERYVGVISGRAESEFLNFLVSIRAILRGALVHLKNEWQIGDVTEQRLEPFKDDFERLKSRVSSIRPGPGTYRQLCELVPSEEEGDSIGGAAAVTIGEVVLGDYYEVGEAVNVGPNSHVHEMVLNQWRGTGLEEVASELGRLREAMLKEASEPEHHVAVGKVASAEIEARKCRPKKAFDSLARAGEWAFDVACRASVPVVTAAMKQALGLK